MVNYCSTWLDKITENFPIVFFSIAKVEGNLIIAEIQNDIWFVNTKTRESGKIVSDRIEYIVSNDIDLDDLINPSNHIQIIDKRKKGRDYENH